MNIYIIRHGQTHANVERRVQGWLDVPLNENGFDLALKTGRAIKDIKFDAVFSSPLIRAYQTAECILKENANPVPKIVTDGRIKEMYFGDWEGQLKNVGSVADGTFLLDPSKTPVMPNGESFVNLFARTQAFLNGLIASTASANDLGTFDNTFDNGLSNFDNAPSSSLANYENVLVSTHGCALRAMLNMLYENKDNFWQNAIPPNCSISLVKADNGIASLVYSDKVFY